MKNSAKAFAVHMFTASGAVFALFAMLAAGDNNWSRWRVITTSKNTPLTGMARCLT